MLKKATTLLLVVVMAAAAVIPAGCSKKADLNIFTYADYIPDDVIKAFEKETGLKVSFSTFDSNEEMLEKLRVTKNQYDLIICSDYMIDTMVKEGGLIQKLDTSKISDYGNIDPAFQSKYYDPNNEYTIPHAAGSALLVYDSAKVNFPVTSYADLWRPEFKDRLVVLDDMRDVMGMVMLSLGYTPSETDPTILEQVKEKLIELKPNIKAFDANKPHEMIINGEAYAGYMYGSQVTAAMEGLSTAKYVFPSEGMNYFIDNYVMPAGAPHPDNAYKFLEYVLQGDVAAQISSEINYMCCDLAAKDYLPQEYLDNPTVNIPPEELAKSHLYENIGDASVLYDEIWTEFMNSN